MKMWFFFVYNKGNVMLSINDKTLITPKQILNSTDIATATAIHIAKPAKGTWIPYIYLNNFLGIKGKSIGVSQVMYDSFEVNEEELTPTTGELVEEYGMYKIFYREGCAKKLFPHQPKRLNNIIEIYIIDKVTYKGEPVLETIKWLPMYGKKDKRNTPGDLCELLHGIGEGIKEEVMESKGKLTD